MTISRIAQLLNSESENPTGNTPSISPLISLATTNTMTENTPSSSTNVDLTTESPVAPQEGEVILEASKYIHINVNLKLISQTNKYFTNHPLLVNFIFTPKSAPMSEQLRKVFVDVISVMHRGPKKHMDQLIQLYNLNPGFIKFFTEYEISQLKTNFTETYNKCQSYDILPFETKLHKVFKALKIEKRSQDPNTTTVSNCFTTEPTTQSNNVLHQSILENPTDEIPFTPPTPPDTSSEVTLDDASVTSESPATTSEIKWVYPNTTDTTNTSESPATTSEIQWVYPNTTGTTNTSVQSITSTATENTVIVPANSRKRPAESDPNPRPTKRQHTTIAESDPNPRPTKRQHTINGDEIAAPRNKNNAIYATTFAYLYPALSNEALFAARLFELTSITNERFIQQILAILSSSNGSDFSSREMESLDALINAVNLKLSEFLKQQEDKNQSNFLYLSSMLKLSIDIYGEQGLQTYGEEFYSSDNMIQLQRISADEVYYNYYLPLEFQTQRMKESVTLEKEVFEKVSQYFRDLRMGPISQGFWYQPSILKSFIFNFTPQPVTTKLADLFFQVLLHMHDNFADYSALLHSLYRSTPHFAKYLSLEQKLLLKAKMSEVVRRLRTNVGSSVPSGQGNTQGGTNISSFSPSPALLANLAAIGSAAAPPRVVPTRRFFANIGGAPAPSLLVQAYQQHLENVSNTTTVTNPPIANTTTTTTPTSSVVQVNPPSVRLIGVSIPGTTLSNSEQRALLRVYNPRLFNASRESSVNNSQNQRRFGPSG